MTSNKPVVVFYNTLNRFLRWLGHVAALLLPAGLLAMSIFGASYHSAHASGDNAVGEARAGSRERGHGASCSRNANWAKETGNGRFFKVIVVGTGDDPLLADLRKAVAAAGGAVNYRYQSIQGFSATIPGPALNPIAQRPDVDSISPNRPATKTTSLLELATGAAAARTLAGFAPGYDGSGVGIAILDSGIYSRAPRIPRRGRQRRRVAKMVDLTRASDSANAGVPMSTMGQRPHGRLLPRQQGPAEPREQDRQHEQQRPRPLRPRHGRRVGRGRSSRRGRSRCDGHRAGRNAVRRHGCSTPRASARSATCSPGIDWVIYHSKEYGIRVLNLSLAADSTESFRTDPLCRAARAATAAGLTVVVAAGNYGKNAAGGEQYGTITSPGNDPSVITVGSANTRNTALRGDDVVNGFSSRGPTCGVWIDAAGNRPPRQRAQARPRRPGQPRSRRAFAGRQHVQRARQCSIRRFASPATGPPAPMA